MGTYFAQFIYNKKANIVINGEANINIINDTKVKKKINDNASKNEMNNTTLEKNNQEENQEEEFFNLSLENKDYINIPKYIFNYYKLHTLSLKIIKYLIFQKKFMC